MTQTQMAGEPPATPQPGAGLSLLEERLLAHRADQGYGLDPAVILSIITTLIPLIQACFKPSPAALKRRLFNRARVAAALYRDVPAMSWVDAFRASDRLFDLAAEAKDEELQALIDDCQKEK